MAISWSSMGGFVFQRSFSCVRIRVVFSTNVPSTLYINNVTCIDMAI